MLGFRKEVSGRIASEWSGLCVGGLVWLEQGRDV